MQAITPQPRNVGIYLVTPTGPAILSYIPRELAVYAQYKDLNLCVGLLSILKCITAGYTYQVHWYS